MRAALACGLMLLAGAALAQDAPPPVSAEFVRLFADYCLAKFPDAEALAKTAAEDKLEPLTTAQLQNYLRSDPGQGWLIRGADGDYVLTEENPPYHACALRRYGAALLDSKPLFERAKGFLAQSGKSFGEPKSSRHMIGPGIISNGLLFPVIGASGQATNEGFMFFVVTYPPTTKPDGTAQPMFMDMRFVRQIQEKAV